MAPAPSRRRAVHRGLLEHHAIESARSRHAENRQKIPAVVGQQAQRPREKPTRFYWGEVAAGLCRGGIARTIIVHGGNFGTMRHIVHDSTTKEVEMVRNAQGAGCALRRRKRSAPFISCEPSDVARIGPLYEDASSCRSRNIRTRSGTLRMARSICWRPDPTRRKPSRRRLRFNGKTSKNRRSGILRGGGGLFSAASRLRCAVADANGKGRLSLTILRQARQPERPKCARVSEEGRYPCRSEATCPWSTWRRK